MIWRGEREWSFTACGQRRWTESFPMDAILLQLHFCSLQWISINGHSYKHLFSLAHSLALLHGVGFVPATLYLQQLWWMKDSDSQPPFLHLGYTTTFWANTVSFSDPHKYQQVTWNQSCFCSDLIPSTARRGLCWSVLDSFTDWKCQCQHASKESQKLTVDAINLKIHPTTAQNKEKLWRAGRKLGEKNPDRLKSLEFSIINIA